MVNVSNFSLQLFPKAPNIFQTAGAHGLPFVTFGGFNLSAQDAPKPPNMYASALFIDSIGAFISEPKTLPYIKR